MARAPTFPAPTRVGDVDGGIDGTEDADTPEGGTDADALNGLGGDDDLAGDAGADLLFGGTGADTLDGGEGNDRLFGGTGGDTLEGGLGDDILTGGADADLFIFGTAGGQDTIADFTSGEDVIDLSALGLSDVADVFAAATDTSAGVRIDTSGTDHIALANLTVADLQDGDSLV